MKQPGNLPDRASAVSALVDRLVVNLYPLRLSPVYRRYLWGGGRLRSLLDKPLAEGEPVAESWEVADRGEDQSVVIDGPLAGRPLGEIVRRFGDELFGRHAPQERFPLLFKFLDAHQNLSVQVHPGDEQAARLDPPDYGKTEAWVVLHAEPQARIFAGLKRGFDRAAFAREIHRGTAELCLHSFLPRAGDCVLLPAGTVHALGAGLVVAEIQQSSDVTYRLFDWNRVGPDGMPRELHIEQGLAALDDSLGPVQPQTPAPADRDGFQRLAACDKFCLERASLRMPFEIGGDERFHIVSILAGEVDVAGDPAPRPLRRGETMLFPAVCGAVHFSPRETVTLLDMFLP